MRYANIGADFFWLAKCTTLALCAGFIFNQFIEVPLPLVYQSKHQRVQNAVAVLAPSAKNSMAQHSMVVPEDVSLVQLKQLVAEHRSIIVDARPEIFYRSSHIPGAVSLPRTDFEAQYSVVQGLLESNRDKPIIVYCSNNACEDSRLVQGALFSLGYPSVSVFRGGWEEWVQAGGTQEAER